MSGEKQTEGLSLEQRLSAIEHKLDMIWYEIFYAKQEEIGSSEYLSRPTLKGTVDALCRGSLLSDWKVPPVSAPWHKVPNETD